MMSQISYYFDIEMNLHKKQAILAFYFLTKMYQTNKPLYVLGSNFEVIYNL